MRVVTGRKMCGRGAAALCGLLAAVLPLPAEAASGRFCGDLVEGGKSSAATQEEALIAAQKWWSSRAGALGKGYESWDNAEDQALECSKTPNGTFSCRATARPCLPAGVLPENVPKIEM